MQAMQTEIFEDEITLLRQQNADLKWQLDTLKEHHLSTISQLQREIGDRQRAEASLQSSEAEFQALFNAMQDIILILNAEGQHLKVVTTNSPLLYQAGSELLGKTLHEVLPLTTADYFLNIIRQVLASRKPASVEYCLPIAAQAIWFEAHVAPLGEDTVVWVARDKTEQKQAEEELKCSEAKFRSYFELPLIGIAITSPEKGWVAVNDRACEMLGYIREELVQLTWSELTHPEDLVLDLELFQQMLCGNINQYSMEKRYFRKDGVMIYASLAVGCTRKPDNTVDYVAALMQDITDRKLAETALRESEQQLREQAEELEQTLGELQQTQTKMIQSEKMSSLGQLVAGVAHEINNPVNFISGNLTHAKEYTSDLLHLVQLYQQHYPEPIVEIQDAIEDVDLEFLIGDLPKLLVSMGIGAERIQKIVLSLRNFSRMDEAEQKAVDIHEGIDSTLIILQNRCKAKGDQHDINVVKDYGKLPLVSCYPGQLNQVFMNILSNAIDALESSQPLAPEIRIRTEPVGSDRILIKIADNGSGVPLAVQSRLFDPFFTTKPVGKGTGLGLSISYQIVVEKHQGQLSCSSTPEQGTEFQIEIPIHQ